LRHKTLSRYCGTIGVAPPAASTATPITCIGVSEKTRTLSAAEYDVDSRRQCSHSLGSCEWLRLPMWS